MGSVSLGKRLYELSPIWAQNLACSLQGWRIQRGRYTKGFWRKLAWLRDTEKWPLQQLLDYQDEQLRKLIAHCYRTVPYYRELMDRLRLSPGEIRGRHDLPKLPVLTKQDVREHGPRLVSTAFDRKKLIRNHTSGTTGASLELWTTQEAVEMQWATWWRHHGWLGLTPGDRVITFSGQQVVPPRQVRPPYWRTVRPMNQLYMSVYHLNAQTVADYVRAIDRFRPKYFSGYPSAMFLLSALMEERGLRLSHHPEWVTTGAESQLPWQKDKIEQFLAPCSELYGQGEQCGNMSRCLQGRFHEDMEYGIIEALPVDPANPSGSCRMIQTGLTNLAMPLLRYDVGDAATFCDGPCACGRPAPTASTIDGRMDSFIVTPDGRIVGRLACVFKGLFGIVEAQIVQDRLESITIRVVRATGYNQSHENELVARVRREVGDVIGIEVEHVQAIPKSATGKIRVVVSTIGPEFLRQGALRQAQQAAGGGGEYQK